MFPFLSLVTVLTTAYGVNGLVVMLLDSTVYPTVADHHCIASLCGGLTFTSRDGGFHRATTTHYMSERRHAVGCDTTAMACGANSVCDQVCFSLLESTSRTEDISTLDSICRHLRWRFGMLCARLDQYRPSLVISIQCKHPTLYTCGRTGR